jgi:hypothetical protein
MTSWIRSALIMVIFALASFQVQAQGYAERPGWHTIGVGATCSLVH